MVLRVTVIELVALLALLLGAREAEAHRRGVVRTLMLEATADAGLAVLVHLRIPGGAHRTALDLVADSNHDGRYDPAETRALEGHLAARAWDGLAVRSGTTALALSDPETKIRVSPEDGPIELMMRLRAAAPAGGTFRLSVATGLVGDPLDLIVFSGVRTLHDPSRGRVSSGRLQVRMGLGDRVQFRLE